MADEKRKLELSEQAIKELSSQLCAGHPSTEPLLTSLQGLVGRNMFFRAVTYHMVGKVKGIVSAGPGLIIAQMESATWVADSGRFMQAIKDGTLSEVEPVGDAYLNLCTVVDFFPWNHPLPTQQK